MSRNTKKDQKEKKSLITQIDDDECGVYEIFIKSRYYKGTGENITGGDQIKSGVIWANSKGQEIIYKLFIIVKEELSPIVSLMNTPKDIFTRTSHILFTNFVGNERKLKGSELEQAIKDEIKELKKNKFTIGMDEDFNILEVSLEDIVNIFLTLREQKIHFFEDILAEYQKRRQEYNKDLFIDD